MKMTARGTTHHAFFLHILPGDPTVHKTQRRDFRMELKVQTLPEDALAKF